nr:MAG TPA: Caspase 7 [Caudoviricetes sp.]
MIQDMILDFLICYSTTENPLTHDSEHSLGKSN